MKNKLYPVIDLKETGVHLRSLIGQKGYAVKDIQGLLHLSCPQPVYRWFRGQMLPSVDHLYALSNLLHVHMEELLIPLSAPFADRRKSIVCKGMEVRRLAFYWINIRRATA